MVKVGQPAPDFKMEGVMGKDFMEASLSDYRGKWLILFFYPLDFTFVCPTEITAFSSRCKDIEALGGKVLGVSVDSKYSHLRWMDDIGEQAYPLLSDITKEVSRSYDMLIEDQGIALRGTFIIDPEGIVRWMVVNELSVGRSIEETIRVLEALQTGELCPVGWEPGDETLGSG
ncbi:MAG: redoxin domain-containing protein [Armatimonadota bacterium]